MGTAILIVLIAIETGLLIWSIVSKQRHRIERAVIRIGELIVFVILTISGIIVWRFQYVLFLMVLIFHLIISAIILLNKKEKQYKPSRVIFAFIINSIIFVLALVPALVFPQYKEIETTGNYAVENAKYTWVDESRVEEFADTGENRAVTVEIWYPENADKTFPLVIFSHGAFGHSQSNYSTFMEIASNGYVVASIGHTYHAFYTIDTEGELTTVNTDFINSVFEMNALDEKYAELLYNTTREWMELRVDDSNFVLDTILDNVNTDSCDYVFSIIDTERVGLIGHSLGGASSAQLGRERDDVDCVVNLDGTMLGEWTGVEGEEIVLDDTMYPLPLLVVYSQSSYDSAKEECDTYANFHAAKNAQCAYEVVLADSGHLNLTDLPLFSPYLARKLGVGTVDAEYCIRCMNEIILQFFDCYLKDGEIPKYEKVY